MFTWMDFLDIESIFLLTVTLPSLNIKKQSAKSSSRHSMWLHTKVTSLNCEVNTSGTSPTPMDFKASVINFYLSL